MPTYTLRPADRSKEAIDRLSQMLMQFGGMFERRQERKEGYAQQEKMQDIQFEQAKGLEEWKRGLGPTIEEAGITTLGKSLMEYSAKGNEIKASMDEAAKSGDSAKLLQLQKEYKRIDTFKSYLDDRIREEQIKDRSKSAQAEVAEGEAAFYKRFGITPGAARVMSTVQGAERAARGEKREETKDTRTLVKDVHSSFDDMLKQYRGASASAMKRGGYSTTFASQAKRIQTKEEFDALMSHLDEIREEGKLNPKFNMIQFLQNSFAASPAKDLFMEWLRPQLEKIQKTKK